MCIKMRTNIVLDEKLVQRAKKITGLKTKRDLVEFALSEIVRRHELLKLLELEGSIDWEGDLKEMRRERIR